LRGKTIKQSDLPLVRPLRAKLSPGALRFITEVERVFPGATKDIIIVRRRPTSPTPRDGEMGNFSQREKV
jgi:hypothetical protein